MMPQTPSQEELDALQQRIGHQFQDIDHLLRALTHPSYANESPGAVDNQRMEFLGDSVLNLAISTELFRRFSKQSEGRLSRLRSALVRETTLAERAGAWELGSCLRLGRGERLSGGQFKDSVLADAYEAVLAAIYMDSDFETASAVIVAAFEKDLAELEAGTHSQDYKTRLQEQVQSAGDVRPRYAIIHTEGPPHARKFTAQVKLGDEVIGQGEGMSKKAAQQAAARVALENLQRPARKED